MVLWLKDCLINLKRFPKKRQGVLKKNKIVLIRVHLEPTGHNSAYSGARVQSRFYPGDLVIRMVLYPGELAYLRFGVIMTAF